MSFAHELTTFGGVVGSNRDKKGVLRTWAKQERIMGKGAKRPVSFPE